MDQNLFDPDNSNSNTHGMRGTTQPTETKINKSLLVEEESVKFLVERQKAL